MLSLNYKKQKKYVVSFERLKQDISFHVLKYSSNDKKTYCLILGTQEVKIETKNNINKVIWHNNFKTD